MGGIWGPVPAPLAGLVPVTAARPRALPVVWATVPPIPRLCERFVPERTGSIAVRGPHAMLPPRLPCEVVYWMAPWPTTSGKPSPFMSR